MNDYVLDALEERNNCRNYKEASFHMRYAMYISKIFPHKNKHHICPHNPPCNNRKFEAVIREDDSWINPYLQQ